MTKLFPVEQNHGFTPHLTLDYFDANEDVNIRPTRKPAMFDKISLWWGDEHLDFDLSGDVVEKEFRDAFALAFKGGKGSGFFGHSGRPGKRGGSALGSSAGADMPIFDDDPESLYINPDWGGNKQKLVSREEARELYAERLDELEELYDYDDESDIPEKYWLSPEGNGFSGAEGPDGEMSHTRIMARYLANYPDKIAQYGFDPKAIRSAILMNKYEDLNVEEYGVENGFVKIHKFDGKINIITANIDKKTLRKLQGYIDSGKIPKTSDGRKAYLSWQGKHNDRWRILRPSIEELMVSSGIGEEPSGNSFVPTLKDFILERVKANRCSK